jgi:uncharacterized protein YidB (DUF937 family)
MGLLDTIGAMAGDASQGDNAKVMGGLIQALQAHPDGIQGIIKSFTENGLGDHATALANGESPTVTPEQVKQGFTGTGLIEQAAAHAGVSPQVVQMAMTTILPLVMSHFASSSATPAADGEKSGGLAGMAKSVLKKFF